MKQLYNTVEDRLVNTSIFEAGGWINLINPTAQEISEIITQFNIKEEHLRAALDEEERAHIDTEDDYTIIIVDIPIVDEEAVHQYGTIPLEIIIGSNYILTICLRETNIINDFINGRVKGFYTYKKTRFILQILHRNAAYFLSYLRHIDKLSGEVEKKLHISMKNKELIELLNLEKSLVYFTTSLRANEIVLEKMMRMDTIKQYTEDRDLLEDVIIENKQAIEMANIYSNILSGMMDVFASIISNNLNIVMKRLTSITIVLSIPTMIFSLYGMNVPLPLQNHPLGFMYVLIVAFVMVGIISFYMIKEKFF